MKAIGLLLPLFLVGCGCQDDLACRRERESADMASSYVTEAQASAPTKADQPDAGRFVVRRVDVVVDSVAYNGKRGVYVITDTKTGAEFVGVSGVGISELGSHRSGKTTVTDER